ncbi:MAG: acetyltransferase [Verrucomicrobiota bacterium]
MSAEKSTFNEWALVELFGHQKIVGKVSEASLAGGAFLRVDVPAFNGQPAFTRFYGPGAVYSINPVTEEIARGLADRYRNEPVSRYELPQLAEKVAEPDTPVHCPECGELNDHCSCPP